MQVATAKAVPRGVSLPAAIFDISRGRQALLSVAQPVLCALLALDGLPTLRVIVFGAAAAITGELAVFSLNDVLDHRVDAESLQAGKGIVEGFDIDTAFERHPIARGDVPLAVGITWMMVLASVCSVCAWLLSPWCLLFFSAAGTLEVLYCLLRRITWLKTVVSGVMVGLGSLAGWVAVASLDLRALWLFVFLATWEIGGRNLPNDLADLESDSRVGLATVANLYGQQTAAGATFSVAIMTVALAGLLPMPMIARLLALAGGAWLMVLPGWRLWMKPTPAQATRFFNHASLYPAIVVAALLVSWIDP